VPEAIKALGGVPVESRVGHVFMKAKLAEAKAPIGGELSGHFYFADMFNADSGARAFIAALNALVESDGKPLSALVKPFQHFAQSGEINFQIEDKDGALAELRRAYAGPGTIIDELDGVTIDCFASEGWWFNVRKSNTEPLLRLNAEARDRGSLDRLIAELAPTLGKQVDH
jgi:phosphomannomutase